MAHLAEPGVRAAAQEEKRAAQQRYAAELQAQVQAKRAAQQQQQQAPSPFRAAPPNQQPPPRQLVRSSNAYGAPPQQYAPPPPQRKQSVVNGADAYTIVDPVSAEKARRKAEHLAGLQEQMRLNEARKRQERADVVADERRALREARERGMLEVRCVCY